MLWPEMDTPTSGPLAGVRVIELARIIAGPLTGMVLADLGADVLKIERPGGDEMRHYGPERWQGTGSTFLAVNRNKRSLVLDLAQEADRDRLLDLVAEADVVIESYRPGVMHKWGLTFDALRAVNPRIILCSITGFGGHGPAARHGANNLIAESFGGSISVSKDADDRMLTGAPMTDFVTGMSAALAITSRFTTPKSERQAAHIETSLLESQAMMMSGYILGYLATGRVPDRGVGLPFTVPNQIFATADAPIALAANSEDMWRRMCVAIGRPQWLERPEFANNALRMRHQDEIVRTLTELLAAKPRAQWLRAFEEARVTAGPVNTVPDLLAHPQFQAMGILAPVPGGDIPDLAMIRLPFTVNGEPVHPEPHRPPPRLDDAAS
ncbi:CoA transferase [Microbacterium pseudoresistens]|uniref:Crotonobetainyl-CoA:carnitine CoA-transferase CaiB-like acyl-CoA transferase n=1 Tax=Microbacterium pseudoresistens TaxID=640634 RepID=A0A7Y9EUK5_9MICO|nr:CoA transferase [Microbacterium pseudoresistens]NYD54242.1 crotonobetainyl-CoA:carnitine CoA-transferase CaiB-like acyl-CoA transferase [Microbacterium pseudoresistens]